VGNLAWYCLSFLKGFAIGIWIVHFRFYSFLRVQNLEPLVYYRYLNQLVGTSVNRWYTSD
jgi:prolipoprotein diacylglyceryltransferase